MVKPGAKLSVQKHHHRAEHWVVVKGTALVTKGDEKLLITENESTYIPLGIVHCLENPGVIPWKSLRFNREVIWVKMILYVLTINTGEFNLIQRK